MKIINVELPRGHDYIEIYPIGDIHIGDRLQDRNRLRQWVIEVKKKPNRYIIMNGDIINNLEDMERKKDIRLQARSIQK